MFLAAEKGGLCERHGAKVLLGSVTSPPPSACFWGKNRQALASREALVTCISNFNSRGHERVAKEARTCSETSLEMYHTT